MSRGIERKVAERLVVEGFFADVLERIESEPGARGDPRRAARAAAVSARGEPARRAPRSTPPACGRTSRSSGARSTGRPLAYLDSASTAQKPRQVLDAMVDLYSTSYANVHRGVYTIAQEATEAYEGAREKVRDAAQRAVDAGDHLHARRHRGAQPRGLRLRAGQRRRAGDVIVATVMEHHSNLVPWQVLARETGATLRFVPMTDEGELDLLDARRDRGRGDRQAARGHRPVELARHAQPGPRARRLGARARRRDRGRRRAVRAAPPGRRAGARLRLPGLLRPQAVRPVRRRRPVRAAARCWRRCRRS